jgi:hypothetical protein
LVVKFNLPLFDVAKLSDVDLKNGLGAPLATALRDLRHGFTNGLTFDENMLAAVVQLPLVHGTEATFDHPGRFRARGFWPLEARDSSGNVLQLDGPPAFNSMPRDASGRTIAGQYGVTVRYALSHTEPCLIRTASGNQSIPHGVSTDISGWNTTEFSRGGVITTDGTTFTASEAGTYSVSLGGRFEGGTYTAVDLWIVQGAQNIGQHYIVAALGDSPILTTTTVLRLTAGGTFKTRCYQTNGAGVARNFITTDRRISLHRLHNDSTPAATVTGILVGG